MVLNKKERVRYLQNVKIIRLNNNYKMSNALKPQGFIVVHFIMITGG